MVVVAESNRGELELAAPFDIDLEGSVDQDVGDAVVLQQGLDGPEPGHLVEHLGAQLVQFGAVQRQALVADEVADQAAHLTAHLGVIQLVELGQVELVDQPAVQAQADVQEIVLFGRCGGRRRGQFNDDRPWFARRVLGRRLDARRRAAAETEAAHPAAL